AGKLTPPNSSADITARIPSSPADAPSKPAPPQSVALASVQPGLRGFDQVRPPGLGRVVNARSLGKTAVVVHDDAACASSGRQRGGAAIDGWKTIGDVQAYDAAGSSAANGRYAIVCDPHENVVLLERSVVKLRNRRRVRRAGSQRHRVVDAVVHHASGEPDA